MRNTAWWMALAGALLVVTGMAFPGVARAQDCTDPWVVVVKKDNSTVEGRLIKDTEQGVLLEVDGRSTFVPEPDIREVVEDCGRRAAAPAAPPVARRAPAAKNRVSAAEGQFRNTFIMNSQRVLRWMGGGCLGLGCSMFGTGMVFVMLFLVGAITGTGQSGVDLEPVGIIVTATVLTLLFSGISGLVGGSGAAMLLAAQLADFLRADPSAPADPDPLSADF